MEIIGYRSGGSSTAAQLGDCAVLRTYTANPNTVMTVSGLTMCSKAALSGYQTVKVRKLCSTNVGGISSSATTSSLSTYVVGFTAILVGQLVLF